MKAQSVALVTGSSSGIGLETALLLARNGFKTYASMRDLKKSKKNCRCKLFNSMLMMTGLSKNVVIVTEIITDAKIYILISDTSLHI